jgi:hypothetical protein
MTVPSSSFSRLLEEAQNRPEASQAAPTASGDPSTLSRLDGRSGSYFAIPGSRARSAQLGCES